MELEAAFAEYGYDPEIEELLDRSSLPSMLLGDESSTTLTAQTRSEQFSKDFSQTTEDGDGEVNSREFLEELLGGCQSEKVKTSLMETGYNTMMEQLLDRSSLPSMFLGDETITTFGDQNRTEPFNESVSLHSTFEDDSEDVNSQNFLEGLMSISDSKPEGGRTSSRKSLLNGISCDEASNENGHSPEIDQLLDNSIATCSLDGQANSKLCRHDFPEHSCHQEYVWEVNSRVFLEGLAVGIDSHPEGGKTSSRKSSHQDYDGEVNSQVFQEGLAVGSDNHPEGGKTSSRKSSHQDYDGEVNSHIFLEGLAVGCDILPGGGKTSSRKSSR